MPVGWCGDVNNVNIGVVNQLAEIVVGGDALFNEVLACFQVVTVNIADGHQACATIIDVPSTHTAYTDDAFGKLVGWSHKALAQHRTWHDGEQCQATKAFQEISSIGFHILQVLFKVILMTKVM